MNFFDGTNKIPARGNSSRFKPGTYPAIRVDKCSVKDGYNGLRFIVEGQPIAEPTASGEVDKGGNPILPTPVGTTGSWTVQIDGKWGELGKGEAKAFAAACVGLTPEECESHDMDAVLNGCVGPDQPLTGKIVATEAHGHVTKSGFDMTKHVWMIPEGASPEQPTPTGPPAGYFHFPVADPRYATHYYNAQHEIIEV